MKRKRFITLSPECRNIELVKDVGQIPFVLGKEHSDFETGIVESCVKENGENLENVQGLKLIHKRMLCYSSELTGLVYLFLNSRKIDWLSLHHAGRRSYYWTKLYKFLNPNGKVYLKLDMDFRSCDMYDNDEWERRIFKRNTEVMDLITVETQVIKERIQKYSLKDIKVLGNGYCKTKVDPDISLKRNNSFITVGRIGTEQKATEVLLEAFALSAKSHDWNLILIGGIEQSFRSKIDSFYLKYPELKKRVVFKGKIKDRETLYNEYCSARVFVLPSRWEGFPIVSGEALICGLRVIVSDSVPPMLEMTNNQKFGSIVSTDDVMSLSNALIEETKKVFDIQEVKSINKYAENQFSWSKICDRLYEMMMEC